MSGEIPSPADLDRDADELDARRAALEDAVANEASLIAAARVVLTIAGAVATAAGFPAGSTAAEVARTAIDLAERR